MASCHQSGAPLSHRLQGFLYILDSAGQPLPGWPLQMGELQAQVAAADVDGDGALELVAADLRGNIAALRLNGSEVWERHVGSAVAQV